MCGIVGVLGFGDKKGELIGGLKLLEYRGYDSSGIAVIKDGRLFLAKKKGKIKVLEKAIAKADLHAQVGIGHTRWATHGQPSDVNAHPHIDCNNEFAVVHNGIIENYLPLKEELIGKGHKFKSQTDTEVIAHLIEEYYDGDLFSTLKKVVDRLEGSFALCVVSVREPDRMVCARKASPLVVGLAEDRIIFASDITPILRFTKKVVFLEDGDVVDARDGRIRIENQGKERGFEVSEIDWDISQAQRCGHPHFMLKEIHEQPGVINRLLALHIKEGQIVFPELEGLDLAKAGRIYIVGCGTAYHAGLVGKYVFERVARVGVEIDVASEWRYRDLVLEPGGVCIAISQSGETADTLAAVDRFKKEGIKVVAVCNVVGSSLTRMADAVILTHAGLEISVASTKAYIAQLTVMYLLALYIAQRKGNDVSRFVEEFAKLPSAVKTVIEGKEDLQGLAKRHHHFGSFLYLGRNLDYPTALEGALKLKEISYIPAEGYPAGEMKHGPIALIDEYRAVICIATDSPLYEKMYSNIEEIKARKGKIIVLATAGNQELAKEFKEVIFLPKVDDLFSPIVNVVPLQLFAYYVAVIRGCDVDQPRNLAKSVTVE